MHTAKPRNATLALVALASLAVYVLACTSFSPDDSKVVLPAYDRASGALGVAIYDRKTRTTEQLFVLGTEQKSTGDGYVLRPQWTPDGRNVLVLWPADDDTLWVHVLPFGHRGPTRLLALPKLEKAAATLASAFPVVGPYLFTVGESNLIRLNFETGAIKTNPFRGEIALYPSPRGNRIFYAGRNLNAEDGFEVGELDVNRLTLTPFPFPKDVLAEREFLGLSRDGRRIALLSKKDGAPSVVVYSAKGLEKTIALGGGGEGSPLPPIRNVEWSPDGQTLYAAYRNQAGSETNVVFGVLEIPLDNRPVRRTPLLEAPGRVTEEDLMYFQISLSHDGKTIAVASTYLAASDRVELKPKDCALFLVDVTSPKRTVTRVPLTPPRKSDQ